MSNDNEPNHADAEVVAATCALATKAGWKVARGALIALSPEHWNYYYVAEAELLLVPTSGSHARMCASTVGAVRQARSDALVIGSGKTAGGERQIFASICLWSSHGTHWHGPHLPWLNDSGDLWLIPDPRARVDDEPSFRLTAGRLVPAAAPATNAIDRYRGLAAARGFFDRVLEG